MSVAHYDVAIVGLGPVGAILANLLGERGVSTLVVERETEIYSLPRAIQLDGEIMRVLQAVGVAEETEPDLVVAARMVFVDDEGHTLIDWQRPTHIRPQGWNTSYRFHQPTLEASLRGRLAQRASVTVLLNHELFSLSETDAGYDLQVMDHDTDQLVHASARFVVGCDGARSTVRRAIRTSLEDLKSHERWLVVDVLLKRDKPELGEDSIQYCDPKRPATYVRGPHNRRRWELMLLPHEEAGDMVQPERVWDLLAPWVKPEEAELERAATYTFHSVVAEGWSRDGLFLAGDACHQTPPFMGQGMCAGVRDAANLAWKLADVVQGKAEASLLDTYESERSPHVRTFIETAVRLGSVICTTDVEQARRRNEEMRAAPQSFSTPQPRLGPGLWDSAAPAAGFIGEQPFMADGSRLDDVVGYHWAVVTLPEYADRIRGSVPASGPHTMVVAVDSESGRDWLARLGAVAVLVRPDRYVAAVATNGESLDHLTTAWIAA